MTAGLNAISVTAPTGTSSKAQGAAQPVSLDDQHDGGQRPVQHLGGLARRTAGTWARSHAADGTAGYSDSVDLNVPVDTGYRIYVYYRATSGDPWGIYG